MTYNLLINIHKMTQKIMLSFKLILLGDANTGKTAIINQYIYHTFTNTKATTGIDFFTKIFQIQDFIVKLNIFDTAGQQRYLSMTKSYFRGTNAVLYTYSLAQKQSFLNLPNWIKSFQDETPNQALKIIVGTKKDLKAKMQIKDEKKMSFPQKFNKQQKKTQKDVIIKASSQNTQIPEQKDGIVKASNQDIQGPEGLRQNILDNSISEQQIQQLFKNHGVTLGFETSALLNQNIDQVFQQICKYLILKQMNKSNKKDLDSNRERVQTQFSNTRRKHQQTQQHKLSLQQKTNQRDQKQGLCC